MNNEEIDMVIDTLQIYGWNVTKEQVLWLEVVKEGDK